MSRYDNNENVGPTGNANALTNSQMMTNRGICSKYLIKEHSPLYPERFARKGDITLAKSAVVFNELKNKGKLLLFHPYSANYWFFRCTDNRLPGQSHRLSGIKQSQHSSKIIGDGANRSRCFRSPDVQRL